MSIDDVGLDSEAQALQKRAKSLTVGRIVLGVVAFVVPDAVFRLFGFGRDRLSASQRYALRLYAVREFALGVHLWREASLGTPTPTTAMMNTAVDGVDAVLSLATAVAFPELRRGALTVAAFAGFVTSQWVLFTRRVVRHEART